MRGDDELDAKLDARIDAALRTYADPGDAPEARIVLARLMERAHEREVRFRKIWAWLIPATACALAVFIAAVMWTNRPLHPAQKAAQIAAVPPVLAGPSGMQMPAPAAPLIRARPVHTARTRSTTSAPQPLPKLDVFPTPQPLSPQEQQLAEFAQQGPPAEKQAVIAVQQHLGDPLQIAELSVLPLDEDRATKSPEPAKQDQPSQDQPNRKEP